MISVIVPVYNVENYLDQCVQSILKQSYHDFELILVDDGSRDRSGILCDEYKKTDPRIQVVHKKNGGLADARNVGTQIARGSHVTYIDSDDYVSDDYLETLCHLITRYNADLAVTGIQRFYDGDTIKEDERVEEYCYTGVEEMKNVLYQKKMDTSACALLIPLEAALVNPFPVGKYHEDDFTTYKYYLQTSLVAVTTRRQYYYRQRKGSIMHSCGQAQLDELDAADNLIHECSMINPELKKAAESKCFSDYCQVLICIDLSEKDKEYERITKYIKEVRRSIVVNDQCRMKNRIAAALCCIGIKPFIMLGKMINRL